MGDIDGTRVHLTRPSAAGRCLRRIFPGIRSARSIRNVPKRMSGPTSDLVALGRRVVRASIFVRGLKLCEKDPPIDPFLLRFFSVFSALFFVKTMHLRHGQARPGALPVPLRVVALVIGERVDVIFDGLHGLVADPLAIVVLAPAVGRR